MLMSVVSQQRQHEATRASTFKNLLLHWDLADLSAYNADLHSRAELLSDFGLNSFGLSLACTMLLFILTALYLNTFNSTEKALMVRDWSAK